MQNIPEGIRLERIGDGIKIKGLAELPKDEAFRMIEFLKQNKAELLQEMAESDIPGIKSMATCLHGDQCRYLDAPGGRRPICSKADMPVFDMDTCPLKQWAKHQPKLTATPESDRRVETEDTRQQQAEAGQAIPDRAARRPGYRLPEICGSLRALP